MMHSQGPACSSFRGIVMATKPKEEVTAIRWGLPSKIKAKPFDTKQETAAAKKLVNISQDEIHRRYLISFLGCVASLLLGSALVLSDAARYWRLSIMGPIIVAIAFAGSAQQGICGIAYKGVWDPDGCGMRKVEDRSLRAAIIAKAKRLHITVGLLVIIATALFYYYP